MGISAGSGFAAIGQGRVHVVDREWVKAHRALMYDLLGTHLILNGDSYGDLLNDPDQGFALRAIESLAAAGFIELEPTTQPATRARVTERGKQWLESISGEMK